MSTDDDTRTQAVPGEVTGAVTPAPRRRRVWPRVLFGFVAGLLLGIATGLGIAAGWLIAWDAGYQGRVLEGVSVGDVNLSGLDRDQAQAALHAAYDRFADGRVVIETPVGELVVPYSWFARRPDVEAMVNEAMATGRGGAPAERAVTQVRLAMQGQVLPARLTLDADGLAEHVTSRLTELEVAAVDAKVIEEDDGIRVIPAVMGRRFDAEAAIQATVPVVSLLDAPSEVRVKAPMIALSPAFTGADAVAVHTTADRMVGRLTVTFGNKKWPFKASVVERWVKLDTAADGIPRPVADIDAITASLKKVAKGVKRPPQSAVYLRAPGGKVVGVAAGRNGRQLDKIATTVAIAEALTQRARGVKVASVKAVTERIPPKLTTEEALKKGPLMVALGSWKTWFPISERNYFGANIWLPAKIINGTVLFPGRRFEWWSAIGPVTSGRGFGPGGFIRGDHTDPTGALGGGMCSSSTTLFNAALRAGLQMGARSNHRYYINRYPLGLDATVSKSPGGGGQTMSFTNDMKTPVVIRSFRYVAGGVGWVRYEVWGIPDGRTVSLSRPSIANLRKATTRTVYVGTLPHGVREQVEYPADGMDVSVTRVVRNRNGRVIHRETYRSHYTLWNGLIEVGR